MDAPPDGNRRTVDTSAPFRAEPLLGGSSSTPPPPPTSPGGRRATHTTSTSPIEPGRRSSRSPLPCVAHDSYTFHQNCGCTKSSHIHPQRRNPADSAVRQDRATPTRSVRYRDGIGGSGVENVNEASPDARASSSRRSTAPPTHSPCPLQPSHAAYLIGGGGVGPADRVDAQSAARVMCCDDIDDGTTTLAISDASVLHFVVQDSATTTDRQTSSAVVYALEQHAHTKELAMVERDTLSSRRYARHPAPLGRLCGNTEAVPTCMALVATDNIWIGMSNGRILSWRKVASGDTSVDNIVKEMEDDGAGNDGRHTPPLHSKHTAAAPTAASQATKVEGPTVLCHWTRLHDAQHVHSIVSIVTAKAGSVYSVCSGGLVLRWTMPPVLQRSASHTDGFSMMSASSPWTPIMLAEPRSDAAAGKNPQARCATCFVMPGQHASTSMPFETEVVAVGMKSGATFLWHVNDGVGADVDGDGGPLWMQQQQPTRLDPASSASAATEATSLSSSSPRQRGGGSAVAPHSNNSNKKGPRSSPHGGVTAFKFVPTLNNVIGRSSTSVSSSSTPQAGAHVIPACTALCVGHDNGRIVVWTHQHAGETRADRNGQALLPQRLWQITAVLDPRCRSPVCSLALVSGSQLWALFNSGDCVAFDLATHTERSRRRVWRGSVSGTRDDEAPHAIQAHSTQLTHVRFVSGHVIWATGRLDGALTTMFVPSLPRPYEEYEFPVGNNLSFYRPPGGGGGGGGDSIAASAVAPPPALQLVNDGAMTLFTEASLDGDALSEFERVERMIADNAQQEDLRGGDRGVLSTTMGDGASETSNDNNKFLMFLMNANKELLDVQMRLDEHMVVLHDVVEEEFQVLKAFHGASGYVATSVEPAEQQQPAEQEPVAPTTNASRAITVVDNSAQTAALSPPPSPAAPPSAASSVPPPPPPSPPAPPSTAPSVSDQINEAIIAEQHHKLAEVSARLDASQESNALLTEMLVAKDAMLAETQRRHKEALLQQEQELLTLRLGTSSKESATTVRPSSSTTSTAVPAQASKTQATHNNAVSDDDGDDGMTPLSPLSQADTGVMQPPNCLTNDASERERLLEQYEYQLRENEALRAELESARNQIRKHESEWEEAQAELKRAHSALLASSEKFESSSGEFADTINTLERNLLAEANRSAALEQELAQSKTMTLLVGQQNEGLRERLNALASEREPAAAAVRPPAVLRRRKSAKEIAVVEFQQKLLEKTDIERLLDNLEVSLGTLQTNALDAIAAAGQATPPLVRQNSVGSNASFVCSRCSTCVPPTGSARSALDASLAPMMSGSFMPPPAALHLDTHSSNDSSINQRQQRGHRDTPPPALTPNATSVFTAENDEMAQAFQALSLRGEELARALDKATESKQLAAQAFEQERRQLMSRSMLEVAQTKRELQSSLEEKKQLAELLETSQSTCVDKDNRIAELTREITSLQQLLQQQKDAYGAAQSDAEHAISASNLACNAERNRCIALEAEARTLRDALEARAARVASNDDAAVSLAESLVIVTEQRDAAAHRVAALEAETKSLSASEHAMRGASNALALRVAICEGEVGNWQSKVGELEETVRRLQADRATLLSQSSELRQREKDAIEEAWDLRRQLQHEVETMTSALNVEKKLRATHEQRALELQIQLDTQRPPIDDTSRLDALMRRDEELQSCIAAQNEELLTLRATQSEGIARVQQARGLAIENEALRRQLGALEDTCARLQMSERQQERDMSALKALLATHGPRAIRAPPQKTATRMSPQSSAASKHSPPHAAQRRSSSSPPQSLEPAATVPSPQPRGPHRRRPHCLTAGHDPATCIWCAGLTHKTMGGTFGVCGDARRYLEFQHSATAGHVSQPPSHSVSPMPAPRNASTSHPSMAADRHASMSVGTTLSSPVSAHREPVDRSVSANKPPAEMSAAVRELYFSAAPHAASLDARVN